jgi:protein-S-isoprenylcysteine O-methyltransferase Ste14
MQTFKRGLQFALTVGIPLLYVLNLLISADNLKIDYSPLSILGTIISAIGVVIWIVSMINLGSSFGVLPKKQKRVVRGFYKYTKHPMYIGISAAIIGISLANYSFEGLAFYCLITLPVLVIRANLEEKNLVD